MPINYTDTDNDYLILNHTDTDTDHTETDMVSIYTN